MKARKEVLLALRAWVDARIAESERKLNEKAKSPLKKIEVK